MMPKMVIYSGKTCWESYIFQFERVAARSNWSPNRKAEKLLDCLSDHALDYAQRIGQDKDFQELKEGLGRRFSKKDTPSVARKQLISARQREDETLEEFSQRVHFLTLEGHPDANQATLQQIAVESFLVGCKDKRAAETVMEKDPKNIFDAQDQMKAAINNHRAIFGTRTPMQATRQVTFSDGAEDHDWVVRQASTPEPSKSPSTVSQAARRFSSPSPPRPALNN
jgi:hypothetical protein